MHELEFFPSRPASHSVVPLLAVDPFTTLVRLVMLFEGSTDIPVAYLVNVSFVIAIVRSILGTTDDSLAESSDESVIFDEDATNEREQQVMVSLYRELGSIVGSGAEADPKLLARSVKFGCLSFLRCVQVLTHALGYSDQDASSGASFSDLSKYAHLPTPVSLLDALWSDPHSKDIITSWVHAYANYKRTHFSIQLMSMHTPRLVALPRAFTEVISRGIRSFCPRGHTTPMRPALCLICNAIVCSNSTCCQAHISAGGREKTVGGCFAHASKCGDGIGVFLLMKQSALVVLHNTSGAYLDSPYVDAFGEADPNMRRGKPLWLNIKRYEKLQAIYSQHTIPDEIRQFQERSRRGIDWTSF